MTEFEQKHVKKAVYADSEEYEIQNAKDCNLDDLIGFLRGLEFNNGIKRIFIRLEGCYYVFMKPYEVSLFTFGLCAMMDILCDD